MFASSRSAFVSSSQYLPNMSPYSNTGNIGNIGNIGNSGNSGNTGNSDDNSFPVVLSYYAELSEIVTTIIKLLYNFSIGNFDYVNENLTRTTYYNLSLQLLEIKQNASIFPEYENIRLSIVRSLEGLQQAMILYNTLQSTEIELRMCKARCCILDNMTELTNYIKSLSGSVSIFQDVTVTAIAATIKPEIAIYIKLYGYPPGGVFDMERLANAISLAEIQESGGHCI